MSDDKSETTETTETTEVLVEIDTEGHRHLVTLISDISWLIGAADQAGIVTPAKIHDHLDAAVDWLGGQP